MGKRTVKLKHNAPYGWLISHIDRTPLVQGEPVVTQYGEVNVGKIIHTSEEQVLGKGETYEETRQNAYTAYFCLAEFDGTIEISEKIHNAIYDVPLMDNPPTEHE